MDHNGVLVILFALCDYDPLHVSDTSLPFSSMWAVFTGPWNAWSGNVMHSETGWMPRRSEGASASNWSTFDEMSHSVYMRLQYLNA